MFVTNLKQFHGIETNVIHMCYLNFFTDAYFLAHLQKYDFLLILFYISFGLH